MNIAYPSARVPMANDPDVSTESDRKEALRMALELHKQGQGVSRTADAVILTATAFLKFVRDPETGELDARLVRYVRRAIEVMYRAGNHQFLDNAMKADLKATAKLLNDSLHLSEASNDPRRRVAQEEFDE